MLKNIGIMLIMVDGLGNYAKELPRNFSQPICLIITVAQNYWNKEQCKQKSTNRSSHHLVSVLWLWLFSYDIMPANEREDRLWAAGSPIDSLDSHLIGHYTTQQSLENCRIFPHIMACSDCPLKGAVTCCTILMVTANDSRGILFGLLPEIEQEAMIGRLAFHRGH